MNFARVARSLSQDNIHSDEHYLVSIFCSCHDSVEGLVASIALQLLQNKGLDKASLLQLPISRFRQGGGRVYSSRFLWEVLIMLISTSRPKISLLFDGIDKLDVYVRSKFLDAFYIMEMEAGDLNMRVLMSSETNVNIRDALRHYSLIDREQLRSECLKTLEFQEWNAREIGVQEVEAAGIKFFGHEKYINWIESDGSSVLWLEGKPGSGKSTLAKFMVKELEKNPSLTQERRVNLSQDTAPSHSSRQKGEEEWVFNSPTDKSSIIARFYYSFRGGNTQTSHELMLRSIVYQIWRENSKLFPLIRDRYQELKRGMDKTGGQKPVWSYDDLKLALKSLHEVNFNLSVFIIIDGMDESNNDKRVDILKCLLDLAHATSNANCTIKIFIGSRPENDINSRLRLVPNHIKLQDVNEEDIRIVVEEWAKQIILEDKCEEETLRQVKKYIMRYSDGVFMWVTLVLRELQLYMGHGGYTEVSLDAKLRSFPKELGGKDGFYRTMVNSLVENYKDDLEQQERGQRILAWVAFADRPISVSELEDALATPAGLDATDLSKYNLDSNRPKQLHKAILSTCGGLVEVRGSASGDIVQLIHQTAREFLLHKDKLAEPYHLYEAQGDMEIAMSCGRYLSIVFRPEFPLGEASAELQKVETVAEHLSNKPLLVYALLNFQAHLDHLGSNDEVIRDEFIDFVELLINRGNSYASLLLGKWIHTLKWPTKLHVDDTSAKLFLYLLLSCAAKTGIEKVVEVLLSLRPDLLHIVAGQAQSVTIEQLYKEYPHITPTDIGNWGLIPPSDKDGSGLKLLLKLGVDVNSKDGAGRTPLSYASENGHLRSFDRLFLNGAEANLKDAAGRTPLSYASENGHQRSLDRLLLNGAEANLKDAAGRTPLSYASENGHQRSLDRLLQHGAEANLKDATGRTPLSYASENGHMAVVKLLEPYITA